MACGRSRKRSNSSPEPTRKSCWNRNSAPSTSRNSRGSKGNVRSASAASRSGTASGRTCTPSRSRRAWTERSLAWRGRIERGWRGWRRRSPKSFRTSTASPPIRPGVEGAFQQALPPRVRWEAEGSSHPFRSRSPAPRAAASTLTRGSGPASAIAGSRQGGRAGSIQIPRTRWRPRRSNGLKRRAALLLFAVTVVGILVLAVAVNLPNLVSRTSNPPPPPPPAAPQCKASQGLCIERTVTRVIDGDTLDVEGSLRIRLVLVDAPEPSQAGGSEAPGVLTSLCLGKLALIDEDDVPIGADPDRR